MKKWHIVTGLIAFFCLLYAVTFLVPRQLITIDTKHVGTITIFNGSTGNKIDITDELHINEIMTNLQNVSFKKNKPSFGYMGFEYRVTIFSNDGDELKAFFIMSEDRISYKGHFYTAVDNKLNLNLLQ